MSQDQEQLLKWYAENARPLPWRKNRDPYRIWVSEIMLQQTTVQAVIPYYEKFMVSFPDIKSLAKAPIEKVLEHWAGLGYYSRARNIHKAAQVVSKSGFAKTYKDLLLLPGFGPYTSRAVSSIAFGEPVGIVDGNAIRVLSRRFGLKVKWWGTKGREEIQKAADKLAEGDCAHLVNQALMDLGSSVCTKQSPKCMLCPWFKNCVARNEDLIHSLPLPKPRRKTEIWQWQPTIQYKGNKIALVKNDYAPFLKGQWLLPGVAKKLKKTPAKYHYKHAITHHNIFVLVEFSKKIPHSKIKWVAKDKIKEICHTSLVKKALDIKV